MKIKITATAAITEALKSANGKATSFAITAPADIYALANRAEAILDARGVANVNRTGATVTLIPAGPAAASYKYAAASTRIVLQRGSKDWYLIEAKRFDVFPRAKERFVICIGPKAAADIHATAFASILTIAAERDAA